MNVRDCFQEAVLDVFPAVPGCRIIVSAVFEDALYIVLLSPLPGGSGGGSGLSFCQGDRGFDPIPARIRAETYCLLFWHQAQLGRPRRISDGSVPLLRRSGIGETYFVYPSLLNSASGVFSDVGTLPPPAWSPGGGSGLPLNSEVRGFWAGSGPVAGVRQFDVSASTALISAVCFCVLGSRVSGPPGLGPQGPARLYMAPNTVKL